MTRMLGVRAITHKWGWYACCPDHGSSSLKPRSRRNMRTWEKYVWKRDPDNDPDAQERDANGRSGVALMSRDMYRTAYYAVQQVLDEAIGSGQDDGLGEGIVRDVWLVVQQRDLSRALLRAAIDRLRHVDPQYAEDLLTMLERPIDAE